MEIRDNSKTIGIILAYNCATVLEKTYHQIPKDTLDEVIVFDDGSTDDTVEVAKKLRLKYFTHKNLGYGGNLKYSLGKSVELGGKYMVEIHGDGQYSPTVIPLALSKAKTGFDLVIGSRFVNLRQPLKGGMPLTRYLINIISSYFYRLFLNIKLSEFHSGFHVYSKKLIDKINLATMPNGHLFSFEIIIRAYHANLSISEVPIPCDYTGVHTSINWRKSFVYLFQTLYLIWVHLLTKFSFKTYLFDLTKK